MEQRSEPRHEKRLAMVGTIRRCEEDPSMEGSPIKVETINLSDHGLQFRSDIALSRGTVIRVAVAVDPRNICSVEGEVRWSREEKGEPVVGVQLFAISRNRQTSHFVHARIWGSPWHAFESPNRVKWCCEKQIAASLLL